MKLKEYSPQVHRSRRISKIPNLLLLTPGLRDKKADALVIDLWNARAQLFPDSDRVRLLTEEIAKLRK